MNYCILHKKLQEHCPHNNVAVEEKQKVVALLKLIMDCCYRTLLPFFCQFLSAISESEKRLPHFGAMLPVAETPWKASLQFTVCKQEQMAAVPLGFSQE